MTAVRRSHVKERAEDRCEYCHLPQGCTLLPHEIDHIRAKKHHGQTTLQNTCWACAYCNAAKGSNAAGFDPHSGNLVPLFNPRIENWSATFAWKGAVLRGLTAIGRATIDVLRMNDPERIAHRRLLIASGVWRGRPKRKP